MLEGIYFLGDENRTVKSLSNAAFPSLIARMKRGFELILDKYDRWQIGFLRRRYEKQNTMV